MEKKTISVYGAREHNLKNITVHIPKNTLTVITGLSGSGKSSLAFDTIYAEGQRRYVESLSAYARQFLEASGKPDVDHIDGLSPAISIEQKTTARNPRSTVGTMTEIYDYLRVLFARVGVPYSPATGEPIQSQSTSQMVDAILTMEEKTRLYILAPVVQDRKGEYKEELLSWYKKGFTRFHIDNEFYQAPDFPKLKKNIRHTIEVVVDRLIIKHNDETFLQRLTDSIETAVKISDGLVYAWKVDTGEKRIFSSRFSCPISGFTIEELEPRLFSFNSPVGSCPQCNGLGIQQEIEASLVVPNPHLSIVEGAIKPWRGKQTGMYSQMLESILSHFGESSKTPFESLPEKIQDILLFGSKEEITFQIKGTHARRSYTRPFEGVIPNLKRRISETDSNFIREDLSQYQIEIPCEQCHGKRLNEKALAVKLARCDISEVCNFSIADACDWFKALPTELTPQQKTIAERVLKEILERLNFLNAVGLGYLTLSRMAGTLSGGESQRIRLSSQIGSGLTGVLYVLDEPSIGLHQRDNDRLLQSLLRLRDQDNTVLVVEHDEDAMKQADYLIDMGPRAGRNGGEIISAGTPEHVMADKKSLTGQYLSGRKEIEVPQKRRNLSKSPSIVLKGARGNNLKNLTVRFPLKGFCAITGVSGGGKSSLMIETLYKGLQKKLLNSKDTPLENDSIEGVEHIDKIIDIDQSPIGRTPRSNPATYTGVFTLIRDWFAALPEAKARGYTAGRFSFNVKGGRCQACSGDGVLRIEMHFLPDVFVVCDTCKGKRYNRETLSVLWKGKSIADVLDMTIDEAAEFFTDLPAIRTKLQTLQDVGLGYIHLGQQATTLSGGEAQRVKIAKELSKRSTGKTLYILDEPTIGLHFEDVKLLLSVLQRLVEQGNSVFVIEHNLDFIKTVDWVIDIGPEGGKGGGQLVAEGPPEKNCRK